MTASVGVVIPAYQPDVPILRQYVSSLQEAIDPGAIRIEVDSASERIIGELTELPATINAVSTRRGKGAAITEGFEQLETDILAFADADGSTPVPEVDRIITSLVERPVDLAVGSRRHPDATVETSQSPLRERLGDGFAWLARRLLAVDLYDYQCGAKAITAPGWQQVRQHLTRPGFAWDIELVAVAGALDLRVRELPIEWHDHPDSTVPPVRTSIRLAAALVDARRKAKRLNPGPLRSALGRTDDDSAALIERERPNNE
jgi:hypothetical protein